MLRLINAISDRLGAVSAVLFFVIGLMISYEVVVRYIFLAPTTWAEEGARLMQLWATYIALGYVLRTDSLIRITVLTDLLPASGRRALEIVALLWILLFCIYALWLGIEIVVESVQIGRATATFNQIPKFWTESSIPFGFFFLILQVLAQLWRQVRPETENPNVDGAISTGGKS